MTHKIKYDWMEGKWKRGYCQKGTLLSDSPWGVEIWVKLGVISETDKIILAMMSSK